MMWGQAQMMIRQWHARHPKEELCIGEQLHKTGERAARRLKKYNAEQVVDAMSDVEIDKQWPQIRHVLERLGGQSTGDGGAGLQLWQNGDVLEFEGTTGVISRDDSCDHIGWDIPVLAPGSHPSRESLYWQSGDRRAGQAKKLSPEDSEAWVRKWWKIKEERGCGVNIGLDYAMSLLVEEDRKAIPF